MSETKTSMTDAQWLRGVANSGLRWKMAGALYAAAYEIERLCAELTAEQQARVAAERLPARVLDMCKARGWSLHWTARGAYLHLEASELIEAIRGKRGNPLGEAADVLIVLMSITESQGLAWRDVLDHAQATVTDLETKPHYAGEEYDAAIDDAQRKEGV